MTNRKPKVFKNRRKYTRELDIDHDNIFEGTLKDVVGKLEEVFREFEDSLSESTKAGLLFIGEPELLSSGYGHDACEYYIAQDYYTESESEWKERVKREELALKEWEKAQEKRKQTELSNRKEEMEAALKRVQEELDKLGD